MAKKARRKVASTKQQEAIKKRAIRQLQSVSKRPFRNSLSGVQFLEQDLGLLQIERVEPFSEPAVGRSQQFARLLRLALVAPEACGLIAARSSKLRAFCCCAMAIAVRKAASAGAVFDGSRLSKISPRARWVSASFQRWPVRSVRATVRSMLASAASISPASLPHKTIVATCPRQWRLTALPKTNN